MTIDSSISRPPRVAAIVTAFNRPNVVLEALASVEAQTRPADHIVIVDDASTNSTAAGIAAWLRKSAVIDRAQLVRQPRNQGLAAARNAGVSRVADCDVIAFLDDDDLWPRDYVERVAAAFARHPQSVAATADRLDVRMSSGAERLRSFAAIECGSPSRYLFERGLPGNSNSAYRRQAFHEAGGYDPADRFAEDYPLMLRIGLLGAWVHLSGAPVICRYDTRDTGSAGAPALHKLYPHRRKRVAELLERFILEDGGRAVVPERVWKRRLGHAWYCAARQMAATSERKTCKSCLRRALEYDPWHLRARMQWILS